VHPRDEAIRAGGGAAAVGGAILLSILGITETALGPAQDLARGGAGDPDRIAFSISLAVWAFAGFSIALLVLGSGLETASRRKWLAVTLGIAAALFALSGLMLGVGWLIGWQPAVLLGVVNVPALLLLVSGWVGVGLMSHEAHGWGWRGLLPLAQLGLCAALFVGSAAGGLLVLVVGGVFVVGWIAIAKLVFSGRASRTRSG